MKKLFLFIMLAFSTACFSIDFPEAEFNSVNTYNSGSNYTPNITPVGAPNIYSQNNISPRRASVGRDNDDGDPFMTPVGNAHFMSIFLFATAYVLYKRNKS